MNSCGLRIVQAQKDWSRGVGGISSPTVEAYISHWNPNAASGLDGQKGAWVACEGGQWFALADPNSWGPPHTQFHCFGK